MLKRLKVWTYMTVAAGASLYQFGCNGDWLPWGQDFGSLYGTVWAILREDIFG